MGYPTWGTHLTRIIHLDGKTERMGQRAFRQTMVETTERMFEPPTKQWDVYHRQFFHPCRVYPPRMIYLRKIMIVYSYVTLPEGKDVKFIEHSSVYHNIIGGTWHQVTWNCYFAAEIHGILEVPKACAFITWQETTFLGRCVNPRINRPFGSIWGLD